MQVLRNSLEFDSDCNYMELNVTLTRRKLKTALFAWILKVNAALLLAGPPPTRSLLLCFSGEIIYKSTMNSSAC